MKKAALQAMEKLKTYYQKTDSVVFTVATIIDPRLKLSYHKKNKWEKVFIDAARDQFEAYFKQHYYHPEQATEDDNEVGEEDEEDLIAQIYMQHKPNPEQDEINLYLAAASANGKIDVLQWWKVNTFTFTLLINLNLSSRHGFFIGP